MRMDWKESIEKDLTTWRYYSKDSELAAAFYRGMRCAILALGFMIKELEDGKVEVTEI